MENRNLLFMKELFVSDNDWNSHRELLYVAATKANKSIVEFGCGEGSTPLLRKFCKKNNLHFSSYETNAEYAKKYDSTKVNDYDEVHLHGHGLLFIDLAPGEQRKDMIAKHRDNAEVIVVHDSEGSSDYVYGMKEVLLTFKYRKDYTPEGKPATTAVSNFIDVTEWQL
jgi:hypothetical protein